MYDALICELDRYGGSVIGFAGDAITCWLGGDDGLRATACALAMHQTMERFASVTIPSGATVSLGMKVAVAQGEARRFLVGDAAIQVRDVLAGKILDRLALGEHVARRGEIVLDEATAEALEGRIGIREWRTDAESGARFGVADRVLERVPWQQWPSLDADALADDTVRQFLLPPVYERLHSGQGGFLAELRPAVALFVYFSGIDYEADTDAENRLDAFVERVQGILASYDGYLIQLVIGDKGSYIFAAFGAPNAHEDDTITRDFRGSQIAHSRRRVGDGGQDRHCPGRDAHGRLRRHDAAHLRRTGRCSEPRRAVDASRCARTGTGDGGDGARDAERIHLGSAAKHPGEG